MFQCKMDSFFCIVEAFKPDVIGVTENWANNDISDDELSVSGYDLYRRDRGNDHSRCMPCASYSTTG